MNNSTSSTDFNVRSRLFRLGEWLVDPLTNRIERDGEIRPLRHKAMELLVLLANNAGQVVSRDDIVRDIWDGNDLVASKGIANTIWTLRQLLDDTADSPIYIETIAKRGYRLLARVDMLEPHVVASVDVDDTLDDSASTSPQPLETIPDTNRDDVAPLPRESSFAKINSALRTKRNVFVGLGLLIVLISAIWLVPWFMPSSARFASDPLWVTADRARHSVLVNNDSTQVTLAVSPSGKRFLYSDQLHRITSSTLMLGEISTPSTITELLRFDDSIQSIAWSPDEKFVALALVNRSQQCRVTVLDLTTLQNRLQITCAGHENYGLFEDKSGARVAWSPRGDRIAFTQKDKQGRAGIVVMSSTGESQKVVTTPLVSETDFVGDFSPDGQHLLVLRKHDIDHWSILSVTLSDGEASEIWSMRQRFVAVQTHWWREHNVLLAIGTSLSNQQIYDLDLRNKTLMATGFVGHSPHRLSDGKMVYIRTDFQTAITRFDLQSADMVPVFLTHVAGYNVTPFAINHEQFLFAGDSGGTMAIYEQQPGKSPLLLTQTNESFIGPVLSKNGKQLAFIGRCGVGARYSICLQNHPPSHLQILYTHDKPLMSVSWVKNDEALLWIDGDGDAGIVELADRAIRQLPLHKVARVAPVQAGDAFYWTSLEQAGIRRFDFSTEQSELVVPDVAEGKVNIAAAGNDLFYLHRYPNEPASVHRWNAKIGSQRIGFFRNIFISTQAGISVTPDGRYLYLASWRQHITDPVIASLQSEFEVREP